MDGHASMCVTIPGLTHSQIPGNLRELMIKGKRQPHLRVEVGAEAVFGLTAQARVLARSNARELDPS